MTVKITRTDYGVEDLRQNFLSNRVYDDEGVIIDACRAAWNILIDVPNKIAGITSREWAKTVIN